MREWRRLATCLLVVLATACATQRPSPQARSPLAGAGQLVLVTTEGWEAPRGELRRYERDGQGWREVGAAVPVTIGRAGAAWGLGLHASQTDGPQKREGDGRSPAGVFAIGNAFGYPSRVDTGLAYQAMDAGDWCVDVPGSPYYNRIVDQARVGADAIKDSSEPMRRDLHVHGDQRYRIGFVVEHNPQGVDRAGSCIFAHVWKSPNDATAGCTAMADADLQALLNWLNRRRRPLFILLPTREYARLREAWHLP